MKKNAVLALVFTLLFCGCKENHDNETVNIPSKLIATDNNPITSPVNTKNLDKYMFRDDVQYVDLRSPKMIMNEGYVAGFQFIPYYSIIAAFSSDVTLYRMENKYSESGEYVQAGRVGGFTAQYEESKSIIESLFSKKKYIFLISQGGTESGYVINLLIQLGYNPDLLYNIGGVMNSEGVPPYSSIESNKYFVEGHGDMGITFKYDFMNDLTPISN